MTTVDRRIVIRLRHIIPSIYLGLQTAILGADDFKKDGRLYIALVVLWTISVSAYYLTYFLRFVDMTKVLKFNTEMGSFFLFICRIQFLIGFECAALLFTVFNQEEMDRMIYPGAWVVGSYILFLIIHFIMESDGRRRDIERERDQLGPKYVLK